METHRGASYQCPDECFMVATPDELAQIALCLGCQIVMITADMSSNEQHGQPIAALNLELMIRESSSPSPVSSCHP